MISWALLVALPIVLPVVVLNGGAMEAPIEAWLALFYVSFVSMFAAYFFWYRGLSEIGVSQAGQVQLAQPLLSVVWAALFLGETVDPWLVFTAGAVLLSIVVAVRVRIDTPKSVHKMGSVPSLE